MWSFPQALQRMAEQLALPDMWIPVIRNLLKDVDDKIPGKILANHGASNVCIRQTPKPKTLQDPEPSKPPQ